MRGKKDKGNSVVRKEGKGIVIRGRGGRGKGRKSRETRTGQGSKRIERRVVGKKIKKRERQMGRWVIRERREGLGRGEGG